MTPASPSMLEIARQAVALGKAKGAQEVGAGAYGAREVEVVWRDGKLEKISEATSRGLGLQLFVDGRYSAVSTSDLRPEALDRFVENAVAMARALTKDPFRALPDPALYHGQAELDLELEDPGYDSLTAQTRRGLAQQLEQAARSVEGASALVSVTSSVSDSMVESFRVHSNGFEGTRRETSFWLSADVSVKDPDGRRPEDSDFAGARFFASLPSPAAVGAGATRRALRRLGAKKGASAVLPVVIDPRAAGKLVGQLISPLSAGSLQQKRSMFEGKRGGAVIGGPLLEVTDDPLVVRGFGSQLFDSEGIAAKRLPLFSAGALQSFYVDTYYGKKLGMAPTTGRTSNLAWKLGDRSQGELLAQLGDAVLVTSFLGGNSNGTTGDFSLGIQGLRVRGGKTAEPIAEMNVSGNHLELWKRLVAVGNDPYPYSALRTPTLVFDGVQVAGT